MKLRVLSHTHWDREWFLPAMYVRRWLPPFFDALETLLRDDTEYRFVLDGQTILVEDAERAQREDDGGGDDAENRNDWNDVPEERGDSDRFHRVASDSRVSVGPYYQQPDWNLVSPEALIRNIRFGISDAESLGGAMRCGWLMDNFGQISQCPQIHGSFGLKTLFMWRGLTLPPNRIRTEYRWESPDGSAVTAVYLLDSYRNGMQLLADPSPAAVRQRVRSIADRLEPFSPTGLGVVMNGYDQETEPEAINEVLADLRRDGIDIRQTTPDAFARELQEALSEETRKNKEARENEGARENPDVPLLPVVRGEQYSGRYIAVFPGVFSARVYLKRENWLLETEIERYTEPLLLSAHLLAGLPAESFVPDLERVWRRILRNHPHDSICGVSVDPVHRRMEERFQRIRSDLGRLATPALGVLAESSTVPAGGVNGSVSNMPNAAETAAGCVFNPLPRRRSAVVTTPNGSRYVPDVPPLGWAPIPTGARPRNPVRTGPGRIENGLIAVTAEPDGTITLSRTRSAGEEIRFSGVLALEDGGDAGDTYNWSPPPEDIVLTESELIRDSEPAEISIETADVPFRASLIIRHRIMLPESLTEDRRSRSDRRRTVPVIHRVTLDADAPGVRITTALRNTVRDHRLRVIVPLPWEDESRVLVGAPMDTVPRPARPESYREEDIPPGLRRVMLGARERESITTLPMRDYLVCTAATSESKNAREPEGTGAPGIGIFAPGVFEYEYRPGSIALTLLRSVGWLARPDLSTRIGDAGPLIATPEAQCLRDLEFEMVLYPLADADEAERVPAYAEEARAPVRYYPGLACPGVPSLLVITSAGDRVRFSAMSVARVPGEEERGGDDADDGDRAIVLVRLYNPGDADSRAAIRWHPSVDDCTTGAVVSLGDEFIRDLGRERDGSWGLDVPAHGIRQCRFNLRRTPDRADVPHSAAVYDDADASRNSGNRLRWCAGHLATAPIPDPVTDGIVRAEEQRVRDLEQEYEQVRSELRAFEPDDPERNSAAGTRSDPVRQRVRSRVSTLWRTLLEARLSLTLLKHDEETCREELHRIGRELNAARIAKRSDDYLMALKEETTHESGHQQD